MGFIWFVLSLAVLDLFGANLKIEKIAWADERLKTFIKSKFFWHKIDCWEEMQCINLHEKETIEALKKVLGSGSGHLRVSRLLSHYDAGVRGRCPRLIADGDARAAPPTHILFKDLQLVLLQSLVLLRSPGSRGSGDNQFCLWQCSNRRLFSCWPFCC